MRWLVALCALLLPTSALAQVPNAGGSQVPNAVPGVMFLGTPVPGNCTSVASIGPPVVLQDAGAPCGSGGGGNVAWSGSATPGDCSVIQSSGPPVTLIDAGAGCLLQTPDAFHCAGTPIHLTAPYDLTNTAWLNSHVTPHVGTQTDPFGGMAAGDITSTFSGGGVISGQNVTLSTSTIYETSGYFKSFVSPIWLLLQVSDNIANAWGSYFDFANGVVGGSNIAGGGTLSCAHIQTAGNGWYQYSFAGSSSAMAGGFEFVILFVTAGNGSNNNGVNGQEFYYYMVGP